MSTGKRKPEPTGHTTSTQLKMSRSEAESKLNERVSEGNRLASRDIHSDLDLKTLRCDDDRWREYNVALLKRMFSTKEFADRYGMPPSWIVSGWSTLDERVEKERDSIRKSINQLRSIVEQLPLIDEMQADHPEPPEKTVATPQSRKVFIVHGHNHKHKEATARFIEKLGLEPVILHEKPNRGATLIEKLEHNADVSFAIIIMSADDMGGTKESPHDKYQTRARQNVLFEFGYFCAKLGRKRTCILRETDVEIPSDLSGIVYQDTFDNGGWKHDLAMELKAAGFEIDLNRIV